MLKLLTAFILILATLGTAAAQRFVDKKSYDDAVRTLRAETRIPLRIPTYFIVPSYFTRKDRRMPLITSFLAEKDSYSLAFCYTGVCQGSYNYGEVTGEKITDKTEKFAFDKTVELAQGITGYYQKSSCGSSCGNAWIFWRQDGCLYSISLVVDDLNTLIKVVNSAIDNNLNNPQTVQNTTEALSIKDFLKATLKSEDKLDLEANGDLNGDGLADWAGVISRKKSPPFVEDGMETDQTFQLYVLLRQKQGGYVVAEKSKETGLFGLGGNFIESLDIKRSSIFLHVKGNIRYGSFSQFRLYRGEWRLVGWRESDVPPEPEPMTEKDRNLLTGTVIETRQVGNRKPTVKRYKKKFPRILLKDFNLFGWNDIE